MNDSAPTSETRTSGGAVASALHDGAVWTAVAAAAFCVAVGVLLVVNHVKGQALDPKDSVAIATLKKALSRDARNESLKDQVRALDLELRRDYFRRSAFATRGAWLLVGGLVVFLAALKGARELRKTPPMPQHVMADRNAAARAAAKARRAVTTTGVVVGASALALAIVTGPDLPWAGASQDRSDAQTRVVEVSPYASPDEMARNWPQFRGPGGLGVSAYTNVPTTWNGKTGENIVWKAEVPLPGPNSPVVWGDRVFLSGATKKQREVFAFDTATGKLVWRGSVDTVPGRSAKPPEVMEATGYAAPTVATYGRRVYAIFANGDLAAFDFVGTRVWAKNLGAPDNSYGHASSLTTWHDRLLVLYDQATEDDDKSKLIAFDGPTGRTVWEARRKVGTTWGTPLVATTPTGPQVFTVSVPWVIAYDPATGAELWRADCMDGEIAPTPVYANDHLLVAQAYAIAAAIRTDGRGDVTKTHIAWRAEDGLPDTCSPLTNGSLLFLATAEGMVTCYDVKTGAKLWEHDFETQFLASPSLVGDAVYLFNNKGVTIRIAAANAFKELGRADLGEKVVASPAFQPGRIYIRGRKHLFCIGKSQAAKGPDTTR